MAFVPKVPQWTRVPQAALNAFVFLSRYGLEVSPDTKTIIVKPVAPVNNPPSGKPARSVEDYLWLLWDLFTDVVCQVPNNHPWQGRAGVELLAAIEHCYRNAARAHIEPRKHVPGGA